MLLVNLVAAVDLLNKQTELLRIPRKEKRKGKKKRGKSTMHSVSVGLSLFLWYKFAMLCGVGLLN